MKKIIALLVVSLIPSFANAALITLDFKASEFVGLDGAPPPQKGISGRFTWEADSITSRIQKLLSIDLVINGFTYDLGQVATLPYSSYAEALGAKQEVSSMSSGTDDFALYWGMGSGYPPLVSQYINPVYTSVNPDISPLVFGFTTINSQEVWLARYLELSFTESHVNVSEPSILFLVLSGLVGVALRRKV